MQCIFQEKIIIKQNKNIVTNVIIVVTIIQLLRNLRFVIVSHTQRHELFQSFCHDRMVLICFVNILYKHLRHLFLLHYYNPIHDLKICSRCITWFLFSARRYSKSYSVFVKSISAPFTVTLKAFLSIVIPLTSIISFCG